MACELCQAPLTTLDEGATACGELSGRRLPPLSPPLSPLSLSHPPRSPPPLPPPPPSPRHRHCCRHYQHHCYHRRHRHPPISPASDACNDGWYDAATVHNRSIVHNSTSSECQRCPGGVQCNGRGNAIQNLPILPDFWRYSPTTDLVFECDHPSACDGSNLTAITRALTLRKVLSNNYGNELCADSYEGVLCG